MTGLEILNQCSNEELDVLVKIIIDKGGATESLTGKEQYQRYFPNHQRYIDAIKNEILDFGSNTFWFQSSYEDILKDVCDKVDADYSSSKSIEANESALLAKIATKMYDKMSSQERENLLKNLSGFIPYTTLSANAFLALFKAGGFSSYQLSVIIANAISKLILNRGLSIAANAALTRGLAILTGPIGMVIMAAWTIVDFAGPAYRVTVPAIIYIAALRKIHTQKD